MDTLTFIAELAKALAWPVSILALVAVLRKPIAELIPFLTRLKFKDLELEFGRGVAELRIEASTELPENRQIPSATTGQQERLIELAQLSPRAAITEAWRQVEVAALDAARRNGISLGPLDATASIRVVRALEKGGVIDSGQASVVNSLRGLRNQAAHAPDFVLPPQATKEYIRIAQDVTDFLASAVAAKKVP